MKQFLLGSGFSLAFIFGCATATIAQSSAVTPAHAAPAGAQKWEYNCDRLASEPGRRKVGERIELELNELGAQGWEFDFGSGFCGKRPL